MRGRWHLREEERCSSLRQHRVCQASSEYRAVTDYFVKTLAAPSHQKVQVASLTRIQNGAVQSRYLSNGENTVMFHGCQNSINEYRIVMEGFKVSCCRAHGYGFGTWLAYNAHYSNSGFVYRDRDGWRHIFVCIASHFYTTLDNKIMRVVGEDCAYPQWMLKYRVDNP
eukprot:4130541-Amphidinium_carterae.1